MKARVKVYSADGATAVTAQVVAGGVTQPAGILPTEGLQFSVEVGGGGGCSFTALGSHLDALSARDALIKVELLTTLPSTWTAVAAYTLRPPFRREKVGKGRVQCIATAVLEQWASECVIFPEYATDTIPAGAGTDRAIGWQSTAYDPSADAVEAWTGCYETARTTMPAESAETGQPWPTGSGATWISITGASDEAERKLFRTAQASPLTIAAAGPIRVYIASDSPGTLYIAGEPVLSVYGGEPGKEPILFQQADLEMAVGAYACAYDTESIWDTGGDGVDPTIIAICTLDADGEPDTWLLVSNETDWVACRRDREPPDNDPPGPTPGATLTMLVDEAQDRAVSGWPGVTLGFTTTTDSESAAWSTAVIERLVRYGSDTIWSVCRMLSETNEVDTWMTPALVLQAANRQGTDRTATVVLENTTEADESHIASMSDVRQADEGTFAVALALDGWTNGEQGTPRREFGMEVGTAITRAVAKRVVDSALAENGRWDGSCRLGPAAPVPLVSYWPGDFITVNYQDAPTAVQVLSCSATAGDGGLLWDLELAELPG